MVPEKVLYWMTLGALTLVIGSHFTSKIEAGCFAEKTRAVAERLSAQGDHLLATAEFMLGRTTSRFDRAQTALVVREARQVSLESTLTRQQIACARSEASRARAMVHQQIRQIQLVCPRPQAGAVVLVRSSGTTEGTI
jgi:hypothetical protein